MDFLWRICIGFGVIPATVALYFRLNIAESPRFARLQREKKEIEEKESFKNSLGLLKSPRKSLVSSRRSLNNLEAGEDEDVPLSETVTLWEFLAHWKNFKVLLGCAVSWFALDVAFYGSNLNQSFVIQMIGFEGEGSVYEKLQKLILGNLIVIFMGTCNLTVFIVL